MTALQMNSAVAVADTFSYPPVQATSPRLNDLRGFVSAPSTVSLPIDKPTAVTGIKFCAVDWKARILCGLLAGFAAIASIAGTVVLMVS
jgi:hypothetical protein